MNTEFESALKLSREKGVGAAEFKRLINEFKSPSKAYEHWLNNIKPQIKLSKTSAKKSSTDDKISNAIQAISKDNFVGLFYGCEDYPNQLASLTEPPPILFASSPIRKCKFAAVVGARKLEPSSENIVKEITLEYIAKGYSIVSGGAVGADGLAHKTALDSSAYTVAVLGCGIDVDYPKSNAGLLNQIREKACVISELMPGTQPAKGFFPTRNRIIAGLADIVIVVQAAEKSGSLITANWAKKLSKTLIIAKPPINADLSLWQGSLKLLEDN